MTVRNDCRHFRGDIPCRPHKAEGVHCQGCPRYDPLSMRILIIKLGAIGDVIRTTPLLRKLKAEHPGAEITWLTHTPEMLSSRWVDRILALNVESAVWLAATSFDWLINLDKDAAAVALAETVRARKKSGFAMDEYGKCRPLSPDAAEAKWRTGLWDDVNRANTMHYVEEMFAICGYPFSGEEYILEDTVESAGEWKIDREKPVVGLNTGCGGRWVSRLWPEDYWTRLAEELIGKGYEVLLLGGEREHERNASMAKASGARYFGHFGLETFIHLMNQTDLVVTAVTMAMHIAIGLKKKLVLFNNIFNRHEFHLYGRGVILEPEKDCDCFFSPECPEACMESLRVDTVRDAVVALL